MAYTPHKWSNNDAISASQMNRIEAGIAEAHSVADIAAEQVANATSIEESNGADIARLFDEIEALKRDSTPKS